MVALQNLIVFGVNLADSIMLGRYSETAMSGVSLANQIQFLLQLLVNGAANGLVVIASQYWGKKQTEPIKKIFSAAFYTAVGMSGIMMIIVLISPTGVLGLLSTEPELVAAGADYIKIMAFSYIIFGISNIFIALMRSIEIVNIGFYSSVMALIFNITLNYFLIFGNCGFPELGVRGAAYATLISRIAELIYVLIYVFFVNNKLGLKLTDALNPEKSYFRDYIKAGVPLVLSSGSWGLAMTIQTAIIGRLGAAAIGANAVTAPVYQVISVFYTSSSNAAGVLIGKTVGEGDTERVKQYSRRLQVIFVMTGVVSSLLLFILRDSIIDIFAVSEETRVIAVQFINVLTLTVIGSAYEMPCLTGIVAGGGDTKFTLYNDFIFMWLIVLPMSALSAFCFKWPPAVTFLILKADQILKCPVAFIKVNRYKWIKTLTR